MAPTSSIRKTNTPMIHGPNSHQILNAAANNDAQPRRTTASGRAIRATTTRPANYYARPFGSLSTAAEQDTDASDSLTAGFFPALQYFTDAITALPKEVMKQFTLVKEVEAKVYGPNEKLGELIDNLMDHPVPARKQDLGVGAGPTAAQRLLTLTANNSTSGSANASLVNGIGGRHSAQPSLNGSLDGEPPPELEEDRGRRHQYHELRMLTHSLLANLDEKNVVLSEANRVLAQQHMRLDSVWPHVESEISEEARYGSMTHWAYSDNRQKTKAASAGTQNRRDVAAANSLAAAANAFHESEIAQARREAGREAIREKSKGKRTEHAVDSDFDDKPRKAPKLGKSRATALAGSSAVATAANGDAGIGRKGKKATEKDQAASTMVRVISSQGKSAKGRETPRSTPADEPIAKKSAKAKPGPPKKKLAGSAQQSPMLASSPLASSFNPSSVMEPPASARPQSARLRQNSGITNLRHENLQDEENDDRFRNVSSKANGTAERLNGRRKIHETTEGHEDNVTDEQTERQLKEASEQLKREAQDTQEHRSERRQPDSRSDSNSRKGSGRGSKVSTPRQDSYHSGDAAASARSRTTRSRPNARDGSSSAEPQSAGPATSKHKRNMSNSHLVKQLAPFNKSPDLDRHKDQEDAEEELDSLDDEALIKDPEPVNKEPALEKETRRSSVRRPLSRRNTINTMRSSPAPMSRESSLPGSPPPPAATRVSGRTSAAAREAAAREAEATAAAIAVADAEHDVIEDEDEDSEHDPDDPDEPKYCYCNRGSYGEMVACDNENCPREWFHLGCTELREAPSEDEKWYCRECKPLFSMKGGRKGKAGRGGRGG